MVAIKTLATRAHRKRVNATIPLSIYQLLIVDMSMGGCDSERLNMDMAKDASGVGALNRI